MAGFQPTLPGTSPVAPANASFLLLPLAADADLAWPIEQAINELVVADTIEVQATAPGLFVNLPDARQASTGYTTLFNNTGANSFTVRDAAGGNVISPVSGSAWVVYLADNSTLAGTWRTFQLGASVSVAVAAALAGAGLKAITTTLNLDIPITAIAATPTTLTIADRAKLFVWTSGVGVLNLPAPATVGNGWFVQIRNQGSGDLTVTPPSGQIDGSATKTFAVGTSGFVVTDGANWYTLGFGSGAGGGGAGFDFVEINVAGSGDFALSGVNLNRIAYRFIGVLTGNRNIIVPGAIQQYWISNATTGAFSLFVKTAAQAPPGIEVLQNNQAIMYCDGNDVIDAESSTVSFPIPVAQGGTGAVTAATARTNLGATSVGSALFIAADAAAARAAIGATATGSSLITAADAATARAVIAAVPTTRLVSSGNGLSGGGDLSADRTLAVVPGSGNVGYLNLDTVSQTGNYAFVATDSGKAVTFIGGGVGSTFTLPTGVLAIGALVTAVNKSTGNLTLSAAGTLTWLSGSGGVPPTGIRTIARGGLATLHYSAAGVWDLLGGVGVS